MKNSNGESIQYQDINSQYLNIKPEDFDKRNHELFPDYLEKGSPIRKDVLVRHLAGFMGSMCPILIYDGINEKFPSIATSNKMLEELGPWNSRLKNRKYQESFLTKKHKLLFVIASCLLCLEEGKTNSFSEQEMKNCYEQNLRTSVHSLSNSFHGLLESDFTDNQILVARTCLFLRLTFLAVLHDFFTPVIIGKKLSQYGTMEPVFKLVFNCNHFFIDAHFLALIYTSTNENWINEYCQFGAFYPLISGYGKYSEKVKNEKLKEKLCMLEIYFSSNKTWVRAYTKTKGRRIPTYYSNNGLDLSHEIAAELGQNREEFLRSNDLKQLESADNFFEARQNFFDFVEKEGFFKFDPLDIKAGLPLQKKPKRGKKKLS